MTAIINLHDQHEIRVERVPEPAVGGTEDYRDKFATIVAGIGRVSIETEIKQPVAEILDPAPLIAMMAEYDLVHPLNDLQTAWYWSPPNTEL